MSRLTNRAFEILQVEVQKQAGGDLSNQIQQDIVLKRLERLRSHSGAPATLEELQEAILDLFPNFDQKALKNAVKANRSGTELGSKLGALKFATLGLLGAVGGIYILNLPYPMIRWPVARIFPLVLIPSYMSMDYNYRQAVSLVEQADQLVNQASGPADITLGEEKVNQAQKNLDALPVWFLGYFPQRYCSFMQCNWKFTFDEFESARKNIGRMKAKVFQETNAQTSLTQGEILLETAKEQYNQSQAAPDKQTALANWQAALDSLQQIPTQTLAGRMAQTKLVAYQRDFQQVAGTTARSDRSGTLIEVAKQFAQNAAEASQNPPYNVLEWQQTMGLWEDAIERINRIAEQDPDYVEAQKLLVAYKRSLGQVKIRLQAEQESVQALEQAKVLIQNLLSSVPTDPKSMNRNAVMAQFQGITNQLAKVKKGTTGYTEAQELLKSAQKKLQQF